jgi:hypothetical protein
MTEEERDAKIQNCLKNIEEMSGTWLDRDRYRDCINNFRRRIRELEGVAVRSNHSNGTCTAELVEDPDIIHAETWGNGAVSFTSW